MLSCVGKDANLFNTWIDDPLVEEVVIKTKTIRIPASFNWSTACLARRRYPIFPSVKIMTTWWSGLFDGSMRFRNSCFHAIKAGFISVPFSDAAMDLTAVSTLAKLAVVDWIFVSFSAKLNNENWDCLSIPATERSNLGMNASAKNNFRYRNPSLIELTEPDMSTSNAISTPVLHFRRVRCSTYFCRFALNIFCICPVDGHLYSLHALSSSRYLELHV